MKLTVAAIAQQVQQMPEASKLPIDLAAMLGGVTALFGLLTGIVGFLAAVCSLGWAAIRMYETKTAQEWLKKRRTKSKEAP